MIGSAKKANWTKEIKCSIIALMISFLPVFADDSKPELSGEIESTQDRMFTALEAENELQNGENHYSEKEKAEVVEYIKTTESEKLGSSKISFGIPFVFDSIAARLEKNQFIHEALQFDSKLELSRLKDEIDRKLTKEIKSDGNGIPEDSLSETEVLKYYLSNNRRKDLNPKSNQLTNIIQSVHESICDLSGNVDFAFYGISAKERRYLALRTTSPPYIKTPPSPLFSYGKKV